MSLFLPKLSDLLTLYKKTCDALHVYVFRIIWNVSYLLQHNVLGKSYGNYHRDTTMVRDNLFDIIEKFINTSVTFYAKLPLD